MEGLKKGILVRNGTAVGAVGDKYFSSTAIGVIQAFSGNTIPYGYLLADGASYKVADYPDLYAVIGNTYGGDSTNFNVPNLVDKFIQGSTTSGTEKEAGLPNITGTFYHDTNATSSLSGAFFSYTRGSSQNLKNDDTVKSSGYVSFDASKSNPIYGNSNTVQPPALTMVYIIKAFHTNEGVDSGVSDDVINYINNSNSYSTEETLTGGKWIDGKPIYRKVCVFKISEEVNAYDLSDLNFDECWITNGFVKQTDGTVNYPINFFRNNADDLNGAWIRLRLKQLVVQVANLDWFNNNAYVVIEYTKTTDA